MDVYKVNIKNPENKIASIINNAEFILGHEIKNMGNLTILKISTDCTYVEYRQYNSRFNSFMDRLKSLTDYFN